MHETDTENSSLPDPPSAARFRRAVVDDIDALADHRVSMFRAMGTLAEEDAESLRSASADWFRRAMASGEYLAWVAVTDGEPATIVAGAGLRIDGILPRPGQRGTYLGPDGMLLNVYTELAWRGRGLASRLVREILESARACGMERVNLHATDDGRAVYERIGFVPTNEMRFTVTARSSPAAG